MAPYAGTAGLPCATSMAPKITANDSETILLRLMLPRCDRKRKCGNSVAAFRDCVNAPKDNYIKVWFALKRKARKRSRRDTEYAEDREKARRADSQKWLSHRCTAKIHRMQGAHAMGRSRLCHLVDLDLGAGGGAG
jgi:hypothetical protein